MRGYLNEFVFNLALYWVASFCLSLREARFNYRIQQQKLVNPKTAAWIPSAAEYFYSFMRYNSVAEKLFPAVINDSKKIGYSK